MNLSLNISGALLLVFASASVVRAQAEKDDGGHVGIVAEVKGTCWLQTQSSQRQVTASTRLHTGDKVRCDDLKGKEGRLTIELQNTQTAGKWRTTIDPSPKDEWTTIRGGPLQRRDAMRDPLDDWFKLAGSPRAGTLAWVYSPSGGSPGSAVWPASFVIRWIPQTTAGNITLAIRDESGNPLWPRGKDRRAEVAATAGELVAPDLRQELVKYQAGGRQGPLTLVVTNPEGDESRIVFKVISKEQEDTLLRQLAECNGQEGILPYICRAYRFRQLGLYTESAEVYEAALKDYAPDSLDLVLHAIAAHRLTGNYRREQALTHQLPAGTKLPE
jgi:hypothetical protein